jgi:hypothetical protein
LFHGIEIKGSCRKGSTWSTFTFKDIRIQNTHWKHLFLLGRVREPTSWLTVSNVESYVWLGYASLSLSLLLSLSRALSLSLVCIHTKKTKLHQLTHASNQTRESRRLHPRPRRRRSVAPRAARRHRDAPLYARVAESCCVLNPSPEPHAWVVAPARTQGGRVGGVPGVSVMYGVSAPIMCGRYWDRGICNCAMCVEKL